MAITPSSPGAPAFTSARYPPILQENVASRTANVRDRRRGRADSEIGVRGPVATVTTSVRSALSKDLPVEPGPGGVFDTVGWYSDVDIATLLWWRRHGGVDLDADADERLQAYADAGRVSWWAHSDFVIACEPPTEMHVELTLYDDPDSRLRGVRILVMTDAVPDGNTALLIHTDEHGAKGIGPGVYAIHRKRAQDVGNAHTIHD